MSFNSGISCFIYIPSLSNFSLWVYGLNILKYGTLSAPVEAAHCQEPIFAEES